MSRLRVALILFVALTLHQSLFVSLHVGDARPQVMLLVAIVGGLLGGAERGAFLGFTAGLLADLFVQTPLGLAALAFALVGFAVGSVQSGIIHSSWWIGPLTVVVASFAGMLVYGVLGAIIGQSHFVSPRLLGIAVGVALMNSLLALPVIRAMSWAFDTPGEQAYA